MSTPFAEPAEVPAEREIRQIIPAPTYGAIFVDEENGEPWVDTLVGWALITESQSEPGKQPSRSKVLGLVADGKVIVFADEFPNFVGYLSPEGGLDDWRDEIRKAWEDLRNEEGNQNGTETPRSLQRKRTWFDEE